MSSKSTVFYIIYSCILKKTWNNQFIFNADACNGGELRLQRQYVHEAFVYNEMVYNILWM